MIPGKRGAEKPLSLGDTLIPYTRDREATILRRLLSILSGSPRDKRLSTPPGVAVNKGPCNIDYSFKECVGC